MKRRSTDLRDPDNSQYPTPNSQSTPNLQLPTPKFQLPAVGTWELGITWELEVGNWELTLDRQHCCSRIGTASLLPSMVRTGAARCTRCRSPAGESTRTAR